jgi:hypothetical protein
MFAFRTYGLVIRLEVKGMRRSDAFRVRVT